VPKGIFRTTEDNAAEIEENLPEEGPTPIPSVTEMRKTDMWVHHMKSILLCNRTTLQEIEMPEGVEDAEVWQKER